MKKDIYTISAEDVETEETIEDMKYTIDYDSEDKALQAARELAESLKYNEHVCNVFVMAGEYKDTKNGNVYGEPYTIYAISNKDKDRTMKARLNAGYIQGEVDEYC